MLIAFFAKKRILRLLNELYVLRRCNALLTVRTKTGKKICLGYDYKKETLLDLRNKEEFICPACGQDVSLKLGDQRIFHFAHKRGGTCREDYERESGYHMDGKRQLFQWLIRQKIPCELEYYDKVIQQRPDIMFIYKGKKYALEFQCSSIPEKIFMKRTKTYLENGYLPLWILGGNHIQQKKKNIVSLSNFHYLFLRNTTEGCLYIPSYCPEKGHFHLIGSIVSYSVKNAFAHHCLFPVNEFPLDVILNPHLKNQINLDSWNTELANFLLYHTLHPGPKEYSFLHELYNHNLNPHLLPPEIGLPSRHSLLIQTSPVIWQSYLFLDVLAKKHPKDIVSFQEIERSFKRRMGRKEIIMRNLPQFEGQNPLKAVLEYLLQLEKLGFLSRQGETIFQLQKNIKIPRSNQEKGESTQLFLQKNQHILAKM
jgi:competence protein CoiA